MNLLFDRSLYRKRRERLHVSSEAFSKFSNQVASRLVERLSILKKDFKNAWQVGFDGDALLCLLADLDVSCMQKVEMYVVSDFLAMTKAETKFPCLSLPFSRLLRESSDPQRKLDNDKAGFRKRFSVVSNEEALPIGPDTIDVILSPLGLQCVNDIKGVFLQCLYSLKPDGLMMTALIGEDSLWELKTVFRQLELDLHKGISNRFPPLMSIKDAAGLLQSSGFALPVVDRDRLVLSYPNITTLLKDIRDCGHGNVLLDRRYPSLTRGFLQQAEKLYQKKFSLPGGGIQVTLDLIFMSGWSPSSTQQKPLQPGRAVCSLQDVL